MRRLEPVVTCDHCGVKLSPTARSSEISVLVEDETRVFIGDLCDEGRAQLEERIVAVLTGDLGLTLDRQTAKSTGAGRVLPEKYRKCGECSYVGATRSALGQHLKTKHNKSLTTGAEPLLG